MNDQTEITRLFPKVSVIILNWNKPELAILCAKSVLKYSPEIGELILADNGSTPRNLALLRKGLLGTKAQILEIGVNRFYGEGNNIAVESATGEFIVFLNNDVVVTNNWLGPLLESLVRNPKVGAVGPKFVYPDGTLQEAGAFVDRNGHSVQVGKGQNAASSKFNSEKIVHYVSAACLLLRRSDFSKAGGFHFTYEPAYYEDTDLCFSIKNKLDKFVLFQPRSTVVHLESATTSDPGTGLVLNNITELNRVKFLERWGSGGHALRNVSPKRLTVDNSSLQFRGTAGIYTPFNLGFGGGEKYILSIAEVIAQVGYHVKLITDHPYSRLRLENLANEFQLDLDNVTLSTYDLEKSNKFDLFITMGNETAPPVDLLGKRNIHHCQFPFPHPKSIKSELARVALIDEVVVNSEFTKGHYIRSLGASYPEPEVVIITPPVSSSSLKTSNINSKKILSVGRFFVDGHSKRQDALIKAFIGLLEFEPDAELNLVGGSLPDHKNRDYVKYCQELANGYPINFYVDGASSVLDDLTRESSIYWHAAGFEINPEVSPEKCEHFGMSVVEAMSAGLIPIVVGNGGPAEIVEFGKSGFHYQTRANLIRRTRLVLNSTELERSTLSTNAITRSQLYGKAQFQASWRELIYKGNT